MYSIIDLTLQLQSSLCKELEVNHAANGTISLLSLDLYFLSNTTEFVSEISVYGEP